MVIFLSFFFSILSHSSVELVMSAKTQVKMAEEMKIPVLRGFRLENEFSWHKARVKCNGREMTAKIRLHGDLKKHWINPQKSYDIKIKDGSCELMTHFSLIIPDDKSHVFEILAQKISGELGLFYRNIVLTDVQINSEKFTYIMYEKLIPSALEHQGFPDAYIVSQTNAWFSSIYRYFSKYKNTFSDREFVANEFTFSPEMYSITPVDESARVKIRFNRFWDSLIFNREREEFTEETDFLNYFFLVTLFGGYHSLLGDNFDYLYVPSSGKFRPLIYDLIVQEIPVRFEDHFYATSRHSFVLKEYFKGKEAMVRKHTIKKMNDYLPLIKRFIDEYEAVCVQKKCTEEMSFYQKRLQKNIQTITSWN